LLNNPKIKNYCQHLEEFGRPELVLEEGNILLLLILSIGITNPMEEETDC